MQTYKAALIGCSRMGAFIDNEVPPSMRPYSHAAGYEACDRTDLIACADLRPDAMEQVGTRYGIAADRQYTDYRELLEREKPDIVSIATQPEHRTEIIVASAEAGTRAIYAEKALCASMREADRIVEVCQAHSVALNMGTNRRFDPGYDQMKAVIDSGQIGALKTLIIHQTSNLFNGASHSFDLLQRLNSDAPIAWVQAHLPDGDKVIDNEILREDPIGHGIIQFTNGVTAYALNSGRGLEVEAICADGTVTALGNGAEWHLRAPVGNDHRGRNVLGLVDFPAFEHRASTLCLIEDLVRVLDTGEEPRGGVEIARANTELIFAFIESHQRGGARVALPLEGNTYRLERDRAPREPKYDADA
ncbi:MAG: Gfo/Idh/MocA family oxidoreductase [Gemmatimonadetes bacterium]|nr:Gfo/Idh/MocA family oxidoreductase [Gemmatimonadota bacterium]MBT5329885.1 Gfo/Idh/MocA family oxidoreductase [Gemmatimonadota bacterium]MBT6908214.1 Gfo/Idh/MocA family oxidoreductase [Gemmatimonadota bacterium]MBT7422149.1 Gfo/Idh/MocA family oxidoreductase [Gemmatimonadota bacterium]MBT7551120.1 Gfo/Idh/MocA family oxidoreductase [Gemmatimonadota bacterium]